MVAERDMPLRENRTISVTYLGGCVPDEKTGDFDELSTDQVRAPAVFFAVRAKRLPGFWQAGKRSRPGDNCVVFCMSLLHDRAGSTRQARNAHDKGINR